MMSANNSTIISRVAAATITALQAVKFDANGKVTPCSVAGEIACGIAQRPAAAGEVVEVCIHGLTKAIAGANLTEQGLLMVTAAGKVIDFAASGAGDNEYSVGSWQPNINHTSTADGEEIFMLFTGASQFGA